MVDIHCHILPNIDDGPTILSESLDMVQTAVQNGITDLFATPHHMNSKYKNKKKDILAGVYEINERLRQEHIPITIHPGQELRLHRELFLTIEKEEVLTLGNSGKYVLIELPSNEVPEYTNDIVYELLLKGITPIIVHPERNKGFIKSPNLLFDIVQEGAFTQLTAASIVGCFGKKVKSFSEKIIEHNLAHFIASDAHNISTRGFFLQESYELITNYYGIEHTFYFKENAELLLNGAPLQIEKPVRIKKRLLGIF